MGMATGTIPFSLFSVLWFILYLYGFDDDLKLERQAPGRRPCVAACMVGTERNRSDLFLHPKNYGKLSTVYTSDSFVICSTAGMCE